MLSKIAKTTTRRELMRNGAMAIAAAAIGSKAASASFNGLVAGMMREAKTAPVKITTLSPGFSVIENVGGNITVFAGKEASLMVDSGISGQHSQILDGVHNLTKAPLKEVINTHWHFDHTGGNSWLHADGVRLTAHQNTRKHMSVSTTVEPWHYTFPPTPSAGLPTNLLKGNGTLDVSGQHISIHHVEHAHTDGDLMVRFEGSDVLSTGDIFWNGYYPFIDCDAGGDIHGIIGGTRLALSLCMPNTKIVPGHGPIASKDDLQQYSDMLYAVRSTVMSLKKKGMTQAEVIAAKPSAKFDSKWGNYAVAPDDFVALVYKGVCCDIDQN